MPEPAAKSKILGVIKTPKSTVEIEENRVTEKSKKKTTQKKATTPIPSTENLLEQGKAKPQNTEHQKVKKVLSPVPKRTAEERQAAIANYELAQPKRIPARAGKVAENLDRSRPNFSPKILVPVKQLLIDRLLAEPTIVNPTWEILTDNTLSIRQKNRQLQSIGWEAELIPFDQLLFQRMMFLARILEKGIQ